MLWFYSARFEKVKWKKVKHGEQQNGHVRPVSSNHVTWQHAFPRRHFSSVPDVPVSSLLNSAMLMFTLTAVGKESSLKLQFFLKSTERLVSFASVSCYSCVCSDEWGGAHDAADHDNDLFKVIYSFVWPLFLLELGRVPGTLSSTLLKLHQQLCGRPGDPFTPSVWLYTERLADNKPLVHSWIAAWGARKSLFALLLHNGTE